MLTLECPHCNHALQIHEKYAGQRGKCKKCGKGITAPGGVEDENDPFVATDLASLVVAVDKRDSYQVIPAPENVGGSVNVMQIAKSLSDLGKAIILLGCLAPFVVFGLLVLWGIIGAV